MVSGGLFLLLLVWWCGLTRGCKTACGRIGEQDELLCQPSGPAHVLLYCFAQLWFWWRVESTRLLPQCLCAQTQEGFFVAMGARLLLLRRLLLPQWWCTQTQEGFCRSYCVPAADGGVASVVVLRYGFGVGGEYPLAAASAAERSAMDPELQKKRGQTVVLVFSNQGLGNLVGLQPCAIISSALSAPTHVPSHAIPSHSIVHVPLHIPGQGHQLRQEARCDRGVCA